jgi:uncharacterized protein YndB with AHSA1/START domain
VAAKRETDDMFVISRTFDAPRELVYKAWTEPERLTQWFGPKGFTMPACTMDLRPGGVFHYGLRCGGWGGTMEQLAEYLAKAS